MVYVDTSILAAYYCPESLSDKAERAIADMRKPVISLLVEVELLSALSRKVREGKLSRADADRIKSQFCSHIQQGIYRKISVRVEHFQMARDWIGQFNSPLRTLDGLHLAVASSEGLKFLTADLQLAKSAEQTGIEVQVIGND